MVSRTHEGALGVRGVTGKRCLWIVEMRIGRTSLPLRSVLIDQAALMRRTKGHPVQKTRGVALLAASFLAMSGLAACGDEGGESESSSSTASPSAPEKESTSEASASGSESSSAETSESESSGGGGESEGGGEVVELPAAAKKQTKAGAIAFNEFYMTETGRALTTGRTEHLKKYSKDCMACDDFLDVVDDATSNGTRMNKNPTSISRSSASERSDSGYRVEMDIKESAYHEVLKDGSKGRAAEPTSLTVVTDTQWKAQGWVIRDQVRTQ